MKTSRIIQYLALVATLPCCHAARAQSSFDSGSNGSFGPLIVDGTTSPSGTRTIALPPDGVLHCTTINVASGYSLVFTKNAANTPVYLLATGDATIASTIYIDGQMNMGRRGGDGGPGGFPGGQGGVNPSNGFGPGGGKGGWGNPNSLPPGRLIRGGGGYATLGSQSGTGGPIYGNSLLIPLLGGSGGGGADDSNTSAQYGGGGGGGALLIASNTKISFANGSIFAWGGNASNSNGAGSGGAIRLVSPTVTGDAYLYVNGGQEAGFGRIRIDALRNTLNLLITDSASYATFGANMVVTPANLPELRITKAAGQDIALTQTDPVFVLLPAGAPATQTIEVQAKNFNSVVPLVAVLTPEAGERTSYNFDINNTAGGATTGSVQVQIPAGVSTRVDVWTR